MAIESRLLDIDPLTGAVETFHYDDVDDTFYIERVEDIEPLIEHNKWLDRNTSSNWRGDFHRVATIPATVVAQLRQQGILQDPDRLRAWLNERDNLVFRTRPGRI